MAEYQINELLAVIVVIGVLTFLIRALFLFYLPKFIEEDIYLKKGLESVPSSLLVVLVIPFAFFVDAQLLVRPEVFAILLTIPVIWIIKKPGSSLIIAILILVVLNFLLSIL